MPKSMLLSSFPEKKRRQLPGVILLSLAYCSLIVLPSVDLQPPLLFDFWPKASKPINLTKFTVFWRQISPYRYPLVEKSEAGFCDFHVSLQGSFWSEWCIQANRKKVKQILSEHTWLHPVPR